MCPATGSIGSCSPRKRSGARASSRRCRVTSAAVTVSPSRGRGDEVALGRRLAPGAQRAARLAPGGEAAVEDRDRVVAEVAQQPPEAGGAALAGLVVGDHAHARADPGAPGGGLEAVGRRQRMPAAARRAGRDRSRSTSRTAAPGMWPSRQARSPAPGSPSTKRQSTTTRPGSPRWSRSQPGSTSGPKLMARSLHACVRWSSTLPAPRCGAAELRGAGAGAGGGAARGGGLRRLPDGPAHRRRRARPAQAAARARAPDRRRGWPAAASASARASAWACRGSAGPTATAATAARAGRTSATTPASPATTATAATRS